MNDVTVPNFFERSKAGEVFMNPLSADSEYVYDGGLGPVSYIFHTPGVDLDYRRGVVIAMVPSIQAFYCINAATKRYIWLNDMTSPAAGDIADATELALNQAYSRIDVSEAAVYATIGEFKETVTSLSSIVVRVLKIVRALKRLDVKYLRKEISHKELEDRYMEARYAIRPLAYDVVQITAACSTKLEALRFTARGKASVALETVESVTFANLGIISRDFVGVESTARTTQSVAVTAGVLYDVFVSELSKLSIWGLDRPIEAIWELTPFSFILDWFWNIGETISAFTPNPGCRNLGSWSQLEMITTEEIIPGVPTSVNCQYSDLSYARDLHSATHELPPVVCVKKTRIRTPGGEPYLNIHWDLNLDPLKLLDLGIIGKKIASSLRGGSRKMPRL